ncbi:hypothetical protein ACWD33_23325 [Streptomyces xiamenensis]
MSFGQGAPGWGQQGAPDWGALAVEAERKRRRKRMFVIGGSALATLAVGTVVALAIVQQDGGADGQAGGDSGGQTADTSTDATASPTADPSFEETRLPPLPKPREFIADADKDLAPFTADEFYAGETMTVEGREYTKTGTDATEDCTEGVSAELGAVLTEHGCAALLRATFTGSGAAVTVGVAQFPSEDDAVAANAAYTRNLLPLTAGDSPEFCQRGGCRTTTNQVGRYAYFTIAGNSDGTPDSGDGTVAQQAARDGNDHAFSRIILRGETQASASASALVEERRNNS